MEVFCQVTIILLSVETEFPCQFPGGNRYLHQRRPGGDGSLSDRNGAPGSVILGQDSTPQAPRTPIAPR